MPKTLRTSRRTWVAAWTVLCAAGLAATAGLNASAPDPQSQTPVSAECAEYVADIERQLAEAQHKGDGDGVLAFSRVRSGADDDCGEELRDRLRNAR